MITSPMKLSERGARFIQGFEEYAAVAYRHFPNEPWTAGWGHTGPDVVEGTTCTPGQALAWFMKDTQGAVDGVNRCVSVSLTQNEFDALVSFAYNDGVGALAHSTLLAFLNAGSAPCAADEFLKWDHVGGEEVAGLERRRRAERALFLGQA